MRDESKPMQELFRERMAIISENPEIAWARLDMEAAPPSKTLTRLTLVEREISKRLTNLSRKSLTFTDDQLLKNREACGKEVLNSEIRLREDRAYTPDDHEVVCKRFAVFDDEYKRRLDEKKQESKKRMQ